jgi:branched-chain amino acid transport system permease protein
MVGAFYCQYATFIDPNQVFSLAKNFEMLLGPVLGGRTTLLGPILGTSLIKPVQDLLRGFLGGEADALYLIIYGGVLIVGILFMPRGIAKYIQISASRGCHHDREVPGGASRQSLTKRCEGGPLGAAGGRMYVSTGTLRWAPGRETAHQA